MAELLSVFQVNNLWN